MNKAKVRKVWSVFKSHARIVFRGLYRVLCGTLISLLVVTSVLGFTIISVENGWAAVADFILSAVAMVVSGLLIYYMGGGGRDSHD